MIKKKKSDKSPSTDVTTRTDYHSVLVGMVDLLEVARHASARSVNSIMTITYWEIGRRIVESEQKRVGRAKYGEQLITQLATDLTKRFGRGFSKRSLEQMRLFYQLWPIAQTLSAQLEPLEPRQNFRAGSEDDKRSKASVPSWLELPINESMICAAASCFSLPWSHYVQLMSIQDLNARQFYEAEALRGGWSVRQLKRQMESQFYQRTLLSKNKALMLRKGSVPRPGDRVTPAEEIKDSLVLEFLDLKDPPTTTNPPRRLRLMRNARGGPEAVGGPIGRDGHQGQRPVLRRRSGSICEGHCGLAHETITCSSLIAHWSE